MYNCPSSGSLHIQKVSSLLRTSDALDEEVGAMGDLGVGDFCCCSCDSCSFWDGRLLRLFEGVGGVDDMMVVVGKLKSTH